MTCYAIGDIHGQLDLLAGAHALIRADRRRTGDMAAPVVHLGDLVDRGPESAAVIEYIGAGPADGTRWITIRGNHDYMFRLFLQDSPGRDPHLRPDLDWLDPRLGGVETLASYGVAAADQRPLAEVHAEARARVPAAHLAFLDAALPAVAIGQAFLTHAGVLPGLALDRQEAQDLMWIRQPFLQDTADHGALIVHGHTPEGEEPRHFGNRLSVDTGAAYGGPLSVVVIEGRAAWHLTPEGRVPLPPPQSPLQSPNPDP